MRSFAAAGLIGMASASYDQMDFKFIQHSAKFGLSWNSIEEYEFRKNIFANMDAFIEQHNATKDTWTAAHNKLSTWTQDELAKIRSRNRQQPDPTKFITPTHVHTSNQSFPTSWDWIS